MVDILWKVKKSPCRVEFLEYEGEIQKSPRWRKLYWDKLPNDASDDHVAMVTRPGSGCITCESVSMCHWPLRGRYPSNRLTHTNSHRGTGTTDHPMLLRLFITVTAHPHATRVASKNIGEMLLFSKEASTLEACCSLTDWARCPNLGSFMRAVSVLQNEPKLRSLAQFVLR